MLQLDAMWNFPSFRHSHDRQRANELIRTALSQSLNVFHPTIRSAFGRDSDHCVHNLYFLLQHARDEKRKRRMNTNVVTEWDDLLRVCLVSFRGLGISAPLQARLEKN